MATHFYHLACCPRHAMGLSFLLYMRGSPAGATGGQGLRAPVAEGERFTEEALQLQELAIRRTVHVPLLGPRGSSPELAAYLEHVRQGTSCGDQGRRR